MVARLRISGARSVSRSWLTFNATCTTYSGAAGVRQIRRSSIS